MFQNPRQNQEQDARDGRDLDALYFLARAHAATVLPWLRSNAGAEWPGRAGLFASFVLLLLSAEMKTPWMTSYFVAWLGMLAFRRFQSRRSDRQGAKTHTQYSGYPSVAARVFRVSKENRAKALEIVLVASFGGVLVLLGGAGLRSMGVFLLSSAVALAIVRGFERQLNLVRIRRMNDAMIEQQVMNEYWRGGRDDY